MLWEQLSSLYGVCGIVSIMMVCVFVQGKLNKTIRIGIYLFAVMNWVSNVGYAIFPLSDSGNAGAFQDIMHIYVVTVSVVLLSIISLVVIMIGGYRDKKYRSIAIWATIALLLMFAGAIGTNIVPRDFFGIPERFSVFAAAGFNAVLGIYLFRGFESPPPLMGGTIIVSIALNWSSFIQASSLQNAGIAETFPLQTPVD